MKILITGHRGFVGTQFWKTLEARGHDLTGVDIVDAHRPRDARDFFRRNDTVYDLVIHLAAVVGGRAKIEGQPLSVAVDLSIDAEFFGWCVRTKQKRVVYYSSSAAYPMELQQGQMRTRLCETDIELDQWRVGVPDLTYGWSKLTGEFLAQFAEQAGTRVHIFRPFSGYGETQALDYPFPSFIARAARRDDPFEVWGDGTAVRDFIHIDDIVEATLIAVEADYKLPLNLCTGRATSFNELADLTMRQAGYRGEIRHLEAKPVGAMHRVGSPFWLEKLYVPRISLEEGIWRSLKAAS